MCSICLTLRVPDNNVLPRSQLRMNGDGVKESLRATDGNREGMKWLAGKADCLTVKKGEGSCRVETRVLSLGLRYASAPRTGSLE